MFLRRVSIGRAIVKYDNLVYGSCCYSLREWLNIDKIIRRKRVIFNISTKYVSNTGYLR